jgi:DNA-directed RNA polymerase subunit RPC12/RpoP
MLMHEGSVRWLFPETIVGEKMDHFQCAQCGESFYFDLELEGMTAEPGEKMPLACPQCEHAWSYYRPEGEERKDTLH